MHRAARRAHQRAAQTAVRDRSTDQQHDVQATCVNVTIRNPADPDRAWKGTCLVDPGATDSLVPRPHLEAIGLRPKGYRVYELTDGREFTMEVTTADIEFMGETVGGTILLGEADAEPLLGATALASAGIEVDPKSHRLTRRSAVRLKGVQPRV
jgi:clan AA aspartic protease